MPEGITKRRLVPVVLPFDINIDKGQKTKPKADLKIPEVNPVKDPEKKSKVAEKPHVRSIPVRPTPIMPELPPENKQQKYQ